MFKRFSSPNFIKISLASMALFASHSSLNSTPLDEMVAAFGMTPEDAATLAAEPEKVTPETFTKAYDEHITPPIQKALRRVVAHRVGEEAKQRTYVLSSRPAEVTVNQALLDKAFAAISRLNAWAKALIITSDACCAIATLTTKKLDATVAWLNEPTEAKVLYEPQHVTVTCFTVQIIAAAAAVADTLRSKIGIFALARGAQAAAAAGGGSPPAPRTPTPPPAPAASAESSPALPPAPAPAPAPPPLQLPTPAAAAQDAAIAQPPPPATSPTTPNTGTPRGGAPLPATPPNSPAPAPAPAPSPAAAAASATPAPPSVSASGSSHYGDDEADEEEDGDSDSDAANSASNAAPPVAPWTDLRDCKANLGEGPWAVAARLAVRDVRRAQDYEAFLLKELADAAEEKQAANDALAATRADDPAGGFGLAAPQGQPLPAARTGGRGTARKPASKKR